MKLLCVVVSAAIGAAACAPKAAPSVSPQQRAIQRIAEADALVQAGCYDCLVDALSKYEEARAVPAAAGAATAGAVRVGILLAMRERELGFGDSGYLDKAKQLAATLPALQEATTLFFEVANTITSQGGGQ